MPFSMASVASDLAIVKDNLVALLYRERYDASIN